RSSGPTSDARCPRIKRKISEARVGADAPSAQRSEDPLRVFSAGAAIAFTYYPTNNQASGILTNGFVRVGESSLAGIFESSLSRNLQSSRSSRCGEGSIPLPK